MNLESPARMNHFQRLPDEITLEIFSYLSVHTIRCILPKVCQSWKSLSSDEQLWRNITVVTDKISDMCYMGAGAFLSFYQHTPQIQNLRISASMIERLPMDSRSNLRSLHLIDLNCKRLNCLKELWTFQSLEKLTFQVVICTPLTRFGQFELNKVCGLRELKIGKTWPRAAAQNRNKLAVALLKTLLKSSKNIRRLVVKFPLTDDDIKYITTVAKNLRHLHLGIGGLSPAAVASLKALPHLKRLTVMNDRLDVDRLLSLQSLPLVNLKLSEPFMSPVFSSSEMNRFLQSAGPVVSNITHLRLGQCRISNETAGLILKYCPKLEFLVIKMRRECDDEEFSVLGVMSLLHLWNLRVLKIYDMKGKDWGFVRDRWKSHDCPGVDECTLGLHDLLVNWREIELDIE